MKARRVALTLSPRTLTDLSYVALRLGASKSDLVEQFIGDALASMRAVLLTFPDPIDRLDETAKAALRLQFADLLGAADAAAAELESALRAEGGRHG